MKLEIIKETKIGDNDWYELRVDGKYITGSYVYDNVEQKYNQIKENPEILKNAGKKVLKSEEI